MVDYSWEAKEKECWFERLDKSILNVDIPHYQRASKKEVVNKMVKNWSGVAAGTLTVAKRTDGTYWVVDGGHRLTAALKLPDVHSLKCVVFNSLGADEEAEYFDQLNVLRTKPSVEQRFRARLSYNDPDAVKLASIFEECNFVWGGGHNNKGRKIHCLNVAERILSKNNGEEILRKSLCIIDPLYPVSKVDAKILEGVSYIVQHYDIPDVEALKHGLVVIGRDKLYTACRYADSASDNDKVDKCHYAEAFLLALESTKGTGFYVSQNQRGKKHQPGFPTLKKEVKHE